MCGATLEVGLPPTHPLLYVFMGVCVFLMVFSAAGGMIKVLPAFGVSTVGWRATGFPGLIPTVFAVLGVNGILYVSRQDMPLARQLIFGLGIAIFTWMGYFLFVAGMVTEGNRMKPLFSHRPPTVHVQSTC